MEQQRHNNENTEERLVRLEHGVRQLQRTQRWLLRTYRELAGESLTAEAFSKRYGLPVDLHSLQALGRAASRVCRQQGVDVETTPDQRFRVVNVYPVWTLHLASTPESDAA